MRGTGNSTFMRFLQQGSCSQLTRNNNNRGKGPKGCRGKQGETGLWPGLINQNKPVCCHPFSRC